MTRRKRLKRSVMMLVWRIVDPPNRLLAGIAPWWVLIETVGRRTGKQRRTPLARGPFDGDTAWLISVHGRHASWVKNLRRFNRYACSGPVTVGIDPALIRIDLLP
jgi:hypothetical protein